MSLIHMSMSELRILLCVLLKWLTEHTRKVAWNLECIVDLKYNMTKL